LRLRFEFKHADQALVELLAHLAARSSRSEDAPLFPLLVAHEGVTVRVR
jgi:hypothetical protein